MGGKSVVRKFAIEKLYYTCEDCGIEDYVIVRKATNKHRFCDRCSQKRNLMRAKARQKAKAALVIFLLICSTAWADTASWYSVESCKREGTTGVMANGKIFNNNNFTCASWDYHFGTILSVVNSANGRSVIVEVTDRGPNKKLYKQGRVIDLSKSAFKQIANLKQGIIEVEICEIQ